MYAYPHYVEYAISDVVDTFLDLNGLEDTSANRYAMENKLRTGGYSVYLCLDTEIQEIVEDTLANWSDYPRLRDPSDKVYQSRNADGTYTEIEQPQAAACVFDYRTGELKAIVGGRYKPTTRKTLNRASGHDHARRLLHQAADGLCARHRPGCFPCFDCLQHAGSDFRLEGFQRPRIPGPRTTEAAVIKARRASAVPFGTATTPLRRRF